jgi:Cathepsin propeptide inhibitor domain (I29)
MFLNSPPATIASKSASSSWSAEGLTASQSTDEDIGSNSSTNSTEARASSSLEVLSGIGPSSKKSFSPLATAKPKKSSPSGDVLPEPRSSASASTENQAIVHPMQSTTSGLPAPANSVSNGANYLESLTGHVQKFLKDAFLPFGSPKPSPTSTQTLYTAPISVSLDFYATPGSPSSEADHIRTAYRQWCLAYDKQPDDYRFDIFSTHFKLCQRYHEDTGVPLALNQYADLTDEEHEALSCTARMTVIAHEPAVVEKIRTAYAQWCSCYGKQFDESRFHIFMSNYLVVEKYHGETGMPLALNEYADMTEDEYRLGEGRIRIGYKEWCAFYHKTHDEERYSIFARHFKIVENHSRETGASLMLNEYADMTEEEYTRSVFVA